ncbi:SprT family zinc-dependent metalloprotease [Rhodoferax sp.]|uniref:M48 family metallopeptidase n=1 Tax=Rhodoferax sp. TaxID=50421 RepID=UPI0025FCB346|nr:SprT family zinc-dependent metalloprotease [Rhodoferax sp.]
MHPLLRFTLDLFEPFEALAPVDTAQPAPKKVAKRQAPRPSAPASEATRAQAPTAPSGPFEPGEPIPQALTSIHYHHPQATREVRLDGVVVRYAFARGKRRTIGFSVGPDGLAVRAPRWTPLYEVDAALREKADWIVRKLREIRERSTLQQEAQITWAPGAEFPYLGATVRIALDSAHAFTSKGAALDPLPEASGVRILRVALPQTATPAQIRDAVQAWLMREAKALFVQRLDHFAPQLQVQWKKMSLSNAGTRWGSAKSDGSIRLNWRLIHFRPAVVDYVVAHELSHLRVMDHSPRFWDTVRTVVPDYAELRHSLKDPAIPKW